MSKGTDIQWCDSTANPTMGCDGCELWSPTVRHCYAGVLHERFKGHTQGYAPSFEQVTMFPERMTKAAHWSDLLGKSRPDKPWLNGLPRTIFVSDMSDALSAVVTFEYLETEVIENVRSEAGKRHCWLWLTKRPGRMAEFSDWLAQRGTAWPANLWAGTSITTNGTLGRIDQLLKVGDDQTVRFLSVEPQIESIDLRPWLSRLDWIIQGGESGHGARPFEVGWAREVKQACEEAGVPYFLKQLGAVVLQDGKRLHLTNEHGGDWTEWPEDLCRRQMPEAVLLYRAAEV
jgi:protein gp37